ncbi:unnamed protein product [Caenorhabditis brenneri]
MVSNTIPFFKLPQGVDHFPIYKLENKELKKIFKQMNVIDLIELSLCSANSKGTIKSLLLEADSLTFHEDWISLNFPWKEEPFFFLFTGNFEDVEGYRVIENTSYFWATNRDESTIACCNKEAAKYLTALKFFGDLFKVKHYDCTVAKPFNPKKLPKLPKTVRNMKLDAEMTDPKEIARVMEYFKVENELEVVGEIKELHEKMLTIPSIFLNNATRLTVLALSRLNNRTIDITQHSLTSHDINILIKLWKSGSKNLRYLKIFDEDESLDLDEILEDVGATGWIPEKREQMYDLNGELVDLGEYMDVERDSDGKIASVALVGDVFEMLVWDQGAEPKVPKETVPEESPKKTVEPVEPKEEADSVAEKILEAMNWEKLEEAEIETVGEFSRKLRGEKEHVVLKGAESEEDSEESNPKDPLEPEKKAEPEKQADPKELDPKDPVKLEGAELNKEADQPAPGQNGEKFLDYILKELGILDLSNQ